MGVREVGDRFLAAVLARDFGAVRSVHAENASLRMLVPRGFMTVDGAGDIAGRFEGWFAEADPWAVESSSVEEVAGRVAVTYRLRLGKPGGAHLIEQHLVLDVADGHVVRVDLLCSGFRPIVADETVVHRFDAGDLGCADGLAAEFRRQVTSIPVGDVLVVTTRDPAAKEDLPSLARLMGHVVRSSEATGDGRLAITVERGR